MGSQSSQEQPGAHHLQRRGGYPYYYDPNLDPTYRPTRMSRPAPQTGSRARRLLRKIFGSSRSNRQKFLERNYTKTPNRQPPNVRHRQPGAPHRQSFPFRPKLQNEPPPHTRQLVEAPTIAIPARRQSHGRQLARSNSVSTGQRRRSESRPPPQARGQHSRPRPRSQSCSAMGGCHG